jgi:dolichol-phosphate mannosyltransferase
MSFELQKPECFRPQSPALTTSRTLLEAEGAKISSEMRRVTDSADSVLTDSEPSQDRECAAVTGDSAVTVIVPTFREVDNIPHLVERLRVLREAVGLDLELLFMDDDSRDGSAELVAALALSWVSLVTRTTDRGLSQAVLDGLNRTERDLVVIMDADLSHPPEKIPELLSALRNGADVAVGSRFTEGGSTADDWGPLRWLNSRVATMLAFPLTTISDPMSGFFAMRRSTLTVGREFDPIGYKILLEIIVKCRCRYVFEVPIHFDNRHLSHSKLSIHEQLKYFRHLRRLYTFRYGTWSHLAQFLVVGASGLGINLLSLTLLLQQGVTERPAVAIAIIVSMVWNFALNRRFSFSYARDRSIVRQFCGFVAACSVGALVNYLTTTNLWSMLRMKQLAAVVGVLAGTFFNFAASRFLVFRTKHVKR